MVALTPPPQPVQRVSPPQRVRLCDGTLLLFLLLLL